MKNWTDKIINWNQLPGTEVKRLIATWGMTPEQIAKYDRKHGYDTSVTKAHISNTDNPVDFPKSSAKAKAKPATKQGIRRNGMSWMFTPLPASCRRRIRQ